MTMSLPVTLPTPATTGKAGSSAPGKGIATAPGQHKDASPDATGVADMFAALVAALTAQMQPVATETPTGTAGVAAEGAPVVLTPPVAGPVVGTADAIAVVPDGTDAVPVAAVAAVADEAVPQPAAPVLTGDAVAPAAPPASATGQVAGESAETPDTPTTSATPVAVDADADAPATPATPATPAQPHAAARADAGPAAVPAPGVPTAAEAAGGPDVDRGTVAVPATPATPATSAGERTGAAAPARPAAPAADPHVQVARVVRPLRLGNDGAYELALDLTPAELGRVRIDVELRGATISLSLRADNPATRELLQSSLDQLRSELEAAGLQAGDLDVGGRGASDRSAGEQQGAAGDFDVPVETVDTAPTEPTITAEDTASGVNVLA